MPTAQTWTPSRRMQAAAAAERNRIKKELERLSARERSLEAELESLVSRRAELDEELSVLQRFIHGEPAQSPRQRLKVIAGTKEEANHKVGDRLLRGSRIRETAVKVLAATPQAETGVHYRAWFELLTSRGYMPSGKDPLATFLTQISRSPVVKRTTQSGVYRLDTSYPDRALRRLDQLRRELEALKAPDNEISVSDIVERQDRITSLAPEIQATDRALKEALRSLGPQDPEPCPRSARSAGHGG